MGGEVGQPRLPIALSHSGALPLDLTLCPLLPQSIFSTQFDLGIKLGICFWLLFLTLLSLTQLTPLDSDTYFGSI